MKQCFLSARQYGVGPACRPGRSIALCRSTIRYVSTSTALSKAVTKYAQRDGETEIQTDTLRERESEGGRERERSPYPKRVKDGMSERGREREGEGGRGREREGEGGRERHPAGVTTKGSFPISLPVTLHVLMSVTFTLRPRASDSSDSTCSKATLLTQKVTLSA
eukprot:3368124-Rhodomonas_salina.1